MKHIIAILLVVHGAIHLLGFLKGMGLVKNIPFNTPIGAGAAIFWGVSFLLFLLSVYLYYYHSLFWPYLMFLAILISQVLIILSWSDAKYGTILNFLFLLIAIVQIGVIRFDNMVHQEVKNILGQSITSTIINKSAAAEPLPLMVQKWLHRSGALARPPMQHVLLKQEGSLKTTPTGAWMPFTAEQWYTVSPPAFVWKSEVTLWGPLSFFGRDKLEEGKGNMLIKLFGLIPVANAKNDPNTDKATLQRYMAEICWYPSAALEPYMQWETIDELTVRGTMTLEEISVSGEYSFSPEGDLLEFETKRYMGQGKDAPLEVWHIHNTSFKNFSGVRIPNKSEVSWKLAEGDFLWLRLEITDILYNQDVSYNYK
ncbi:DUF6544 family protein [Muriicola sp.]|uniref:DUF6544 family protein n=1 Tax=Muriicola sp. TaxID=2020856 RepID=UPI003C74DACE